MTSSTGSISVTGLLGGTAGQIDVTSLISQLMQAQEVPQNQLKNQLTAVSNQLSAYQAINTKLTALQTAAQALTDPTAWTATAATSSSSSVVPTSTGAAAEGSTTFDVLRLAAAQISTVQVDASGNVAASGATITVAGQQITPASGSASDVAAAINAAAVGVRAAVVQTDTGPLLQLTSAKTGAANAFTASGFETAPQQLVQAQDAQIGVGGPGGYTVSSASNTFTDVIPGVTFSVSAPASNVTITVSSDEQSMSDKVQALVTAANAATAEMRTDTAQGALLQGKSDVRSVLNAVLSSVSRGTTSGGSLSSYGIDMDSTGTFSFDAETFAAAYAADPAGTQAAVSGSFASSLAATATGAVAAATGTITESMASLSDQGSRLTQEIGDWTSRLSDIQTSLTAKFTAMETALARLQSQQTYLDSMFKSMQSSSSGSSSS